jgi:tricarballylate dehydrogenase
VPSHDDVIVVGAGNAALAAAVASREAGAGRVLALEKAPEPLRGGNTHYSGGLLRFAFDRAEDLLPIVPSVEKQVPGFMLGVQPYPRALFWEDLRRVTEDRTDPELAELLISRSYDTVRWMAGQGIVMEAAVSLSGIKVGDTIKWSPGAVIRAQHEGVGLSKMWFDIAARHGVEIRYGTGAVRLLQDRTGRVTGVTVQDASGLSDLPARAVVLACGGFEANPAWRARYLGRPWDHAKVRGTRYNTGDGLRMAIDAGALPYGQWTGCHSTPIDAEAPPYGDRKLTDKTNRLSYPYGVLVNRRGLRFFDEGEDFQFYTYAKLGGIILNQPSGVGFQIFDAKVGSCWRAGTRRAPRSSPIRSARSWTSCPSTALRAIRLSMTMTPPCSRGSSIPPCATVSPPRVWSFPSRTGPSGWTPRPTSPIPSPGASRSPSAG